MIFIMVSLLGTAPVLAHRVIVFAWSDKGMIHIEGSFGSNRPAKACEIKVVTLDGTLIHQGVTDPEGKYSFKMTDLPEGDLVVQLNAGTGHSGQWTLLHQEMSPEAAPETREENLGQKQGADPGKKQAEKLAEKQALEKNPSLARILAGIALIFALALGAAWIKKKQGKAPNA